MMEYITIRILLIVVLFQLSLAGFCSYQTSRRKCSGWLFWRGCKTVFSTSYQCCPGYGGFLCQPKCRLGYGPNTCSINNGIVIYQNGSEIRNSGGICVSPARCENCNKGYYAVTYSDGYCEACPPPPHCNLPVCTSSRDVSCEYCEEEYKREHAGYNVYTGKPNNRVCQKACSWKPGARCFPGKCTGNMVLDKDCTCAPGFGGTDCATALANLKGMPMILRMSLILSRPSTPKLLVEKNSMGTTTFWSKETIWKSMSLDVKSHFKPNFNASVGPNYIKGSVIGIEEMTLVVTFLRGSESAVWTLNGGCKGFAEDCDKSEEKVLKSLSGWRKIFPEDLKHADRIKFRVSAKNGGEVFYEDRSSFDKPYIKKKYNLNGIVTTETLELIIDIYPPVHCYEQSNECATKDALQAEDFVTEPKIRVHWAGWEDEDSGIEKYEFNIYDLSIKSEKGPLTSGNMLPAVTVPSSAGSSTELNLGEAGPYAIDLIVHDRAQNLKIARRIVLFDNASVVELNGTAPKIEQSELGWINKETEIIEIVWPRRFVNIRHTNGGWLRAVKEEVGNNRPRDLDDIKGRSSRTIERIDNIQGIVRFEIAQKVELNGHTNYVSFTKVPDKYFHQEKMVYEDIQLIDGKKLTFFIRGVDVIGEFAEDNVTAMIDLSPPILQNLWLTKGDLVNISVHNVLELQELTIEWEAFDYHSGLHEVHWKIFDNFTKTVVLHGQKHEPPQGETETLDDCTKKYDKYPRGANCYCSPYNGCFHKHYQIKPLVSNESNGGVFFGKEIGEHDYDYYIEVTITNIAGLTTVKHKKITIDTSPPHEGTVHDGIPDDPEVDFQQSLQLAGYWVGFFDKESSVWFYSYGFSERCLNEDDLDIHTPRHSKANWTYDSRVEFTAPRTGKYYLTVMAYNHALGHSKPVCSDGVTIDNIPAIVSEVVIKDAVTDSGLVKSDVNGTVYILHRNRELEEVKDPATGCRNKATSISDSKLALYPHKRNLDGTKSSIKLDEKCNNLHGIHPDLIAYITSDSKVEISWNVSFGPGNVHDYEVGIASENSNFSDVMDFVSSHHHQHIRLFHPDIFDGEQFYVMIKAITKSSVTDTKIIGPFVYDSTKPDFSGEIRVSVEHTKDDTFLLARWNKNAFTDHGDPNALTYEAAIGSTRHGKDILPFQPITVGGSCTYFSPPICTAIPTHALPWHLHGEQDYFVTIKVRDTAGHFVTVSSDAYRHNVELASQGIVKDIDDSESQFADIQDIDYQTSPSELAARWSGFEHPHEDITFKICISNSTGENYLICADLNNRNEYRFFNLSLVPYEVVA